MKLKYQLSLFNAVFKAILLIILWLIFPYIVKFIVYKNTDNKLLEKKEKFINNIETIALEEYLLANESRKNSVDFHTLNDEFIQLKISQNKEKLTENKFINDKRDFAYQINEYRILKHEFTYKNKNYQLEIGSTVSSINDLISLIHQIIVYSFILIIIIIFFVDIIYVSYLLQPFYKILETKIKLINTPEKFNYLSITSKTSEFTDLDTALNQMINRINELFNNEKQFIGNVSHELLTPISILKSSFENLINNRTLNNEVVDKISDSLQTLDLMKKIINNLLLISKIDDRQYKTDESINIEALILEIVLQLEDRIQEKSLNCKASLKHEYLFLGNRTLIRILITNILTNAIKCNNHNGSITIYDEMVDNQYSISISDTGSGMTNYQVSQIFNRFSRLNFDQNGQGLGLSIVKSIANLHHISIKVVSEINSGTTFTLIFQG